MYLRRHNKKAEGEHYEYWSLVESVRTARGPRQKIVAAIGKLPGLDKEERIGREEIQRILAGKKEAPGPIPRPRGDTAGTAVPIVPRYASVLWQQKKGCP